MRKVLLSLVFIFCGFSLFAQDYTSLDSSQLKVKEDYVKAEPKVLECSNFLLSTPNEKNNLNRLMAMEYILKWMEGTNYTFEINANAVELTDGNQDLFGLYITTMPKVVLENKEANLSADEIHNRVVNMLIEYCKNELNTTVSFVVDENGSITDIKAEGENISFNKQAEIAMYLISEKFTKPALQKGNAVKYAFRMPLSIKFE